MLEHSTTTPTIFPLSGDDAARREEAAAPADWLSRIGGEGKKPLEIAEILARAGMPAAALSALQAEVSRCADRETRAHCYLMAGGIREQLEEFDSAALCYEAVAVEDLGDPVSRYLAHNNLGYCLNRLRRYPEAEACCRRAIGIDGARFNAHKNLGIALERTGRLDEAVAAYRDAARAEPRDGRALRRLRVLLANHPEVGRDRPALVEEVEMLRKSAREPGRDAQPAETGPSESRVRRLLEGIYLGEEVAANGFQVFGLWWERSSDLDYSTLDDALAGGTLEVTEISEGGQVPNLKVSNKSDSRVLLMAGEELVGAKQNRVLNSSIMVGACTEMPLPVTCVEQGRWAYRSRHFSTAGTSSHAALRLLMSKQVHAAYLLHGEPRSDQGEVWREVTRKLGAHRSPSRSHALHHAYEATEARLDEVRERIRPDERWSGAVFAFGGAIVGLDLFDKPSTLTKLWPKLIRAYAIDSFEQEEAVAVSRGQVEEWVRGLSRTAVEAFRPPGLGTDIRLEGDRLIGALLMVEETPAHLEVFADEGDD
jgi:tetratricopeptide (TPR) repeat protein